MTDASRPGLEELRNSINGFEAIKCGMRHEAVQRVAGSIEPLPNEIVDHGFLRCEYCPRERRQKHVACAHTNARNVMLDAVRTLQDDDKLPVDQRRPQDLTQLNDDLVQLDVSIFQLDQRRSDIELEHAEIARQVCQAQAAGRDDVPLKQQYNDIGAEITRMESLHDEYVDQAAAIRDQLLARLNSALDP